MMEERITRGRIISIRSGVSTVEPFTPHKRRQFLSRRSVSNAIVVCVWGWHCTSTIALATAGRELQQERLWGGHVRIFGGRYDERGEGPRGDSGEVPSRLVGGRRNDVGRSLPIPRLHLPKAEAQMGA